MGARRHARRRRRLLPRLQRRFALRWWTDPDSIRTGRAVAATAAATLGATAALASTTSASDGLRLGIGISALTAALIVVVLTVREQRFPEALIRRYLRSVRENPHRVVTGRSTAHRIVDRDEICDVLEFGIYQHWKRRTPYCLVGPRGTGKTAVLVRLAERLAARKIAAVVIHGRDLRDEDDDDLLEAAEEAFTKAAAPFQLSETEAAWRRLLHTDRAVLLVDDLEWAYAEMGLGREDAIRALLTSAPGVPLVIATQPFDAIVGLGLKTLDIEPLSPSSALDCITGGSIPQDTHRLDWLDTANVDDEPHYMSVAADLYQAGLLNRAPAWKRREPGVPDVNDVVETRVALTETWIAALVDGHFLPEVVVSKAERALAIERLAIIACATVARDSIVFRADDLPMWVQTALERIGRQDAGAAEELPPARQAAAHAAQLGLIDVVHGNYCFRDVVLLRHLAARGLATVGADGPLAKDYLNDALRWPGRDLLSALAMHERLAARSQPRLQSFVLERFLGVAVHRAADPSMDDARSIDLLATGFDVACSVPTDQSAEFAGQLAELWRVAGGAIGARVVSSRRAAIERVEAGARVISSTEERTAVYSRLLQMAAFEGNYAARVAAALEIGTGGDSAYAALEAAIGPYLPSRLPDNTPLAVRRREHVLAAWLAPLLVGSTDEAREEASANLERWLEAVLTDGDGAPRLPLALEIALAQGFRFAANLRPEHPYMRLDARSDLAEQASVMLRAARFWLSRLTLLHALCLWATPRDPTPTHTDGARLVAHWMAMPNRSEHPFLAEAGELVVLALKTGQPERYVWIDESSAVARIGERPRPNRASRRRHWIPPAAGWSTLDPRAQRLLADVVLLLNLADREHDAERQDDRIERAAKEDLPPCLTEQRLYMDPHRTVGMAQQAVPGAGCKDSCTFDFCPYPPKGSGPSRGELSEAFCARQQALVRRWWTPTRRTARWNAGIPVEERRFWREMEERARI